MRYGIKAILIIAPFYATLVIWAASSFHHLDLFKIWKEAALAAMGLIAAGFLATHRAMAKKILVSRLFEAIIAYILLLFAIGLYDLLTHRVSEEAVVYGWLIDIRPVGIFLITYLTMIIGTQKKLPPIDWKKLVLIPAFLVIAFGFLQMTVLPKDILRHVGYSQTTTPAYQTVDNQPGLVRIQSTTRGPNPLGAYDLLIIVAITAMLLGAPKKNRLWLGLFLALSVIVLFGTYSRSAEVGLVISWLTLLVVHQRRWLTRHIYVLVLAVVLVTLAGLFAASRDNYLAQNIFFHSSSQSASNVSSDSQRSQAIKSSFSDVVHHPWGGGIGSAGPASRRDVNGPVKIAEDYYLQIGQEAGVVGALLFIVINLAVGVELWHRRDDQLALILFASLIGLSFVNLLSHAWSDDTLAYTWWGLAGLALAPHYLAAKPSLPRR